MRKLKHKLIRLLVGMDPVMLNMDISGEIQINNELNNKMLLERNTFRGI
ncbi:TPA: hypothetical protein ACXORD_001668 [Bacillus luti]